MKKKYNFKFNLQPDFFSYATFIFNKDEGWVTDGTIMLREEYFKITTNKKIINDKIRENKSFCAKVYHRETSFNFDNVETLSKLLPEDCERINCYDSLRFTGFIYEYTSHSSKIIGQKFYVTTPKRTDRIKENDSLKDRYFLKYEIFEQLKDFEDLEFRVNCRDCSIFIVDKENKLVGYYLAYDDYEKKIESDYKKLKESLRN